MKRNYDAVVIGGGHNGLVAAAYLAQAGKSVLVLERRHLVGGSAVTEEIYPGFKYSVCSYVVSLLRPEVIRDLNLPAQGLDLLPLESTVTPLPNGDYLARWADHDQTRRELYRHSPKDAEAYDEFGTLTYTFAESVAAMHPYYAMRAIGGVIFWLGAVMMLLNVILTIRQASGQRSSDAVPANA